MSAYESHNGNVRSGRAEFAAGTGLCFLIIALIILRQFLIGPLGGGGPASHAGAGLGEIALIIGVIWLFTIAGITRFVYRGHPMRWLKIASITYLLLLGLSVVLGFIDGAGAAIMVIILLSVGLVLSLFLLLMYFIAWSRA